MHLAACHGLVLRDLVDGVGAKIEVVGWRLRRRGRRAEQALALRPRHARIAVDERQRRRAVRVVDAA